MVFACYFHLLANFVSMQSSFRVPQISGPQVKDTIIVSFFTLWAKMVVFHAKRVGNKIGLVDFGCGAGKNEDGTEAAPLLVLRSAVESEEIANLLVPVFLDKDPKNIIKLRKAVSEISGIEALVNEPQYEKANTCDELIYNLQKIHLLPSLVVLDLISIKDLNLQAISAQIREESFDGVFLLNYSLLENMIANPFKAKHLETAFGKTTADRLRSVAEQLNPKQKESFFMKTFLEGLKSLKGYHYVTLTYEKGKDIHYLVFVTRFMSRYRLMKELMSTKGYPETGGRQHPLGESDKSNLSVQVDLFN